MGLASFFPVFCAHRVPGINVEYQSEMMTLNDDDRCCSLVRWEFSRDGRHLMCAIHPAAAQSFEVATVPLWDVRRTAVEMFSTASAALHRHAAIAADLREAGWTVSAYTVLRAQHFGGGANESGRTQRQGASG